MENQKKRALVNVRDYDPALASKAKGGGEVLTRPDDAETLTEILARAMRGLGVQAKESVYLDTDDFDQEDLEKVPGMELSDRHEFLDRVKAHVSESEQKLSAEEKARKEAEAEEQRLQDEMKEDFKKKKSAPTKPEG